MKSLEETVFQVVSEVSQYWWKQMKGIEYGSFSIYDECIGHEFES